MSEASTTTAPPAAPPAAAAAAAAAAAVVASSSNQDISSIDSAVVEHKDNTHISATLRACLSRGLDFDELPEAPPKSPNVPHAPNRAPGLKPHEFELGVRNALRYFPSKWHATLGPEFAAELANEGHIYMRRFRPTEYSMRAYPLECYPARSRQSAAIQLMIMNNLDPAVAQFPEELITYGGNGSVLSNWAQFHLLMKYLTEMTNEQTLSMLSGHPAGLFPSHPDAPRVVVSNGMVIPNYSSKQDYDRMYALGNTIYGQMTAGSYAYIGPQGIVHGTTITILNAGRKYLSCGSDDATDGGDAAAAAAAAATTTTETDESTSSGNPLAGKVYVSSGLGGMSGAQGKAGIICGAVTVLAEVDRSALDKRLSQGWVSEAVDSLDACIARVKEARANKEAVAIAYHGNIVDLWERFAEEEELLVDLGSDQTSLHNPFNGGYYPAGLTFEESKAMMVEDPARFQQCVERSLCRHVNAVNRLCARGMRFWDYGNAFLFQASKAGADIMAPNGRDFRYPSYVQEFMGDIFSLGFGPFRWVCTSGNPEDLRLTDRIARDVMTELRVSAPRRVAEQLDDNLMWITKADENRMVVGSQARILYADADGRARIAAAFNDAIASGQLQGAVVLSRDHHDVSGTDSPYRETSNVTDGSAFTADMAIQNVIGDALRGATWVSIHNGGGVGWGEVINGGFGMLLDGTPDAIRKASNMLFWDVNNGVSRRAWAGNDNAQFAIKRAVAASGGRLAVTFAHACDDNLLQAICKDLSTPGVQQGSGGNITGAKRAAPQNDDGGDKDREDEAKKRQKF